MFIPFSELKDSYKKQIKILWLQNFCENIDSIQPGTIEKKMGVLPGTIVSLLLTEKKRNVIGMSFLLTANQEESYEQGEYKNMKQQGITEEDIYLYNFCIREKDRKKGKSMELMKEIENYCGKNQMNLKKIILFVKKENNPAISLYNKIGYKVKSSTPEGFFMEKNLQ
jgi:ribosomal protein S18 acetylase RimI-like enzyme